MKPSELVGENNSSFHSSFLLLPVHLLMFDDAMSKSFIYVSAFGQIYTYLLYCPNISKCPWVFEMLKKNRSNANLDSYTATDNVECLVFHGDRVFLPREQDRVFLQRFTVII